VALKEEAGWRGRPWTEEGWAILMMSLLASVALSLLLHRTDWTFGAVVVWVFLAIGTEQLHHSLMPFVAFGFASLVTALSFLALCAKVILWWREADKNDSS